MTPEGFLERCPLLCHVGPIGAWEGIQQLGFRTASQLIADADLTEADRVALMTLPRRHARRLTVRGVEVMLRDQGPLFARRDLLTIMGDGLTVADWVRVLNGRVYLFAHPAALSKVLDKYVERDGGQELITFNRRKLLEIYRSKIELATQNTGAVARVAGPQKFRDTFKSIGLFPDRTPSEVTIVDGIDDLSVVATVERHLLGAKTERLPI